MDQTNSSNWGHYELTWMQPAMYDPIQNDSIENGSSKSRSRTTARGGLHGRSLSEYSQDSFRLISAMTDEPSTQPLTAGVTEGTRPHACSERSDDSGFWNSFKAWYIFLLHACACAGLVIGVIQINGNHYQIGFGSSIFAFDSPLHQVQVTGLISIALVIIRLIAGSGSLVLCWRIVYILLEKRGLKLAELSRLLTWRIGVFPECFNKSALTWSLWGMTTVLLLWPPGFAAPFASSSVSWIPAMRLQDQMLPASISTISEKADWNSMLYPNSRAHAIIAATAMSAQDPAYAFRPTRDSLRRHFNTSQVIPSGSKINITAPYFDIQLQWVNCSSSSIFDYVGNPFYQNVNSNISMRTLGAVAFIPESPWNDQSANPFNASTFHGTKAFSVKLRTINEGDKDWHGNNTNNNNTKCPTVSSNFGKLPNYEQRLIPWGTTDDTMSFDCYLCGNATITAGKYAGNNCIVNSTASNSEYATCELDNTSVEDDYLANLSLAFLSEVLMYSLMLNYSGPWMSNDLDTYTTGMLALGYQATWSALMTVLGNDTETANYIPAQSVVAASINRSKLYIWLGMNATLTLSAILVFIGQSMASSKTIRNTTVAALTIDLSEISHSRQAAGLCNAASLSDGDQKLPKMRWAEVPSDMKGMEGDMHNGCRRRVVFAKDGYQNPPHL